MKRRMCSVALVAALSVGSSVLVGVTGASAAPAAPSARVVQHDRDSALAKAAVARSVDGQDATANEAGTSLGNQLASGQTMNGPTQYLASTSGQFEIAADGEADPSTGLYWNSYSSGAIGLSTDPTLGSGTHNLVMQTDGNLVLYTNGKASWASNTHGNPGAKALLQDDGNFVVYSSAGKALWASHTFAKELLAYLDGDDVGLTGLEAGWYLANNGYKLLMQTDGNLVLYSRTRALWSTRTNGNPGAYAVLEPNGKLAVYSSGDVQLWSNNKSYSRGFYELAMQSDGNLVEYRDALTATSTLKPIWATGTAGMS